MYYLSFVEPSLVTLQQLSKFLSSFFWHDKNGNHRYHWISWDKCHPPCKEEGLGIRKFKDIANAFSIKLWWRYKQQNSLWASNLCAKYANCTAHNTAQNCSGSSAWRRMATQRDKVESHISWLVGEGDIDLLRDSWLERNVY